MKKILAKVLEDNDGDFAVLESCINRFSLSSGIVFETKRYFDAEEFLSDTETPCDVVFFDIELPGGLNGMDAAKKVRESNPDVAIIFVTNMAQYAIDGYQVEALDFVLKPLRYEDFKLKIKKLIKNLENKKTRIVRINTKDGLVLEKEENILYVEVTAHYLVYHCKKGEYITRGTMRDTEKELSSGNFARSGISFLVNLKNVEKVTSTSVIVGGKELTITRLYKQSFLESLSQFMINGGR